MSVVIERTDTARPTWLCEKIGRDFGAGRFGGWCDSIGKATTYTADEAQDILDRPLIHLAPFCKIVEVPNDRADSDNG